MRIGGGNKFTKRIECVDPKRDIWKIRWDFDDNTFQEETFNHKPTIQEIKDTIYKRINEETQNIIINDFIWKEMKINLDQNSQINYKAAYDLAVQSAGVSLPIKFKFGNWDDPIYYKFTTLTELSDFYTAMIKHIQNTLQDGWKKKDNINWSDYKF